ncbi:L,D-transpeptidase [Legionella spiritensis]|uniref:Putative ErfK/YbiS/YcfS/YnhG protein n=1 Tax=Legionella spiritensis TaxID=452 RepID=A0A0W0Z572_LEGSP|nr:L,D-transpeptidase [Legionella spiritensis]KTD63939.1 putative ErfK/YbiS/YcfS/YnhG protein [Legionella spiritensis]SNV36689.1 putative ErfK/YbiS/YcfS/YnhG protein [Legionella spiritensis]
MTDKLIYISSVRQRMDCYQGDNLWQSYIISTAKNGLGEQMGSECTPRGWHRIHARIGLDAPVNSVFVARRWTGEIYSQALAEQFPARDWILTRILQLDGLEAGRNQGGQVDSLQRYIYIHGTPDTTSMGVVGSRGCIRMRNHDMIELAAWSEVETRVFIE